MAGIYIHIPFCKQACNYCNFYFSTQQKYVPEVVDAIVAEAELRKDYLTDNIETIYFGGGTPSLLNSLQLNKILTTLYHSFKINNEAEITLEANPDDINELALQSWKKIGINRLSIGVQSFTAVDLQWMNRAHNHTTALQSLQMATQYFDNISIDLIYGTPTLSNQQWLSNIKTAIDMGIKHLSCYALTVEPQTALQQLIAKKKVAAVDAEHQAKHFELLIKILFANGYEQYEISNFAKANFRSKHNSSYWKGKSYIGLGPSAHSYNGTSRQWNINNNALYIKSIQNKIIPAEIEILTKIQQQNELVMIGLRTAEGINLNQFKNRFGVTQLDNLLHQAQVYIDKHLAIIEFNFLKLTNSGKLMADGIAANLFAE